VSCQPWFPADTAIDCRSSDETELLQHPHLIPLLPTFDYLISNYVIKDQSFEPDRLSWWLCLAPRAIVFSGSYPSKCDFATGNHSIFHRNVEIRKRRQKTSDQLFES